MRRCAVYGFAGCADVAMLLIFAMCFDAESESLYNISARICEEESVLTRRR